MTINIAATALVAKNTRNTYFRILPNLLISTILATLLLIVKKTSGTTMVYIKFKNISPNGFKTLAFSPKITPKIQPMIIEINSIIGKK